MKNSPTRRSFLAAGAGAACASTLACTTPGASAAPPPERRAELDEMFAHLEDQSATESPISASEHAARRARLGQLLERFGFDALLLEGGATMQYLSGTSWGHSERLFSLIVLANGEHFWMCPGFEAEKAKLRIEDDEDGPGGPILTWQEHEYPFRPLASALEERGVERLAIEPALRYRFVAGLEQAFAGEVASGAALVTELRGRKDAHELALLRKANELTQRALVATSEQLRPGMTGRDIGELVTHAQRRLGLQRVWNLSLIGAAAAYPHGAARDTPLAAGSVVLIDTGGSLHGYQSDNTRSWVFGAPPSKKVERVWSVVRDAQRSAFEAIKPGVPCGDIDRVARAVIDATEFGNGYATFTHRLGHGIGLEGHEDPYFDGGSQVVLEEGMTLSNEPGIYLYGEFGIRIEDIVAVTRDGCDHFGSWQKSPRSPA